MLAAGAYAAASVLLSLAAVFAGLHLIRTLARMNEVKRHVVTAEEAGMRLDRWFKVHFPQVTFAYLNKLTRTGQVRVGGCARQDQHQARGRPGNPRAAAGLRHAPADLPKERREAAHPAGAPPVRLHGAP